MGSGVPVRDGVSSIVIDGCSAGVTIAIKVGVMNRVGEGCTGDGVTEVGAIIRTGLGLIGELLVAAVEKYSAMMTNAVAVMPMNSPRTTVLMAENIESQWTGLGA